MHFDWWSFIGGNVTGGTIVGLVLEAVSRIVTDRYEDRRKLTDVNRKALDDGLTLLSRMVMNLHEHQHGEKRALMNYQHHRVQLFELQHRTGVPTIDTAIQEICMGEAPLEPLVEVLEDLRAKIGRRLQKP